jgi:hypothetical protein
MDDGQKVLPAGNGNYTMINCTRWEELKETMKFHIGLAKALNAPTDFRFLNTMAPKRVGCEEIDPDNTGERALMKVLEDSPNGKTPLCQHIQNVINDIKKHEHSLRQNGQMVAVVICTDGEASDGNVAQAMKPLAQLPVMVIIRLCTNEDHVVDYWNNVDRDLEVNIDILDDCIGEATEMREVNPWLNYDICLHRLREWGVKNKELDIIDEKPLTADQMMKVVALILGENKDHMPHPVADFNGFANYVRDKQQALGKFYNSCTRKMEPIIDISLLRKQYGPAGCGCTIS